MDVTQTLQLLGGLSPQQFMRHHWQKKPLLVRQAISHFTPVLSRTDLFVLARNPDVQSRLVIQDPKAAGGWRLRSGPFERRAIPAFKRAGWTLLVQGVDLQNDLVHSLMNRFRFVPDARLDDLMVSYATDQGGVGPHFDSYDVFLLQAHGRRRWRIGKQRNSALQPDVPLKILSHFEPEQVFDLDPGDMLYLPPRYAHDGVALGECMTYSIGFRSPRTNELAGELLQRLAQEADEGMADTLYRDLKQGAQSQPACIPEALAGFAATALGKLLQDKVLLTKCLGEHLTEPKAHVWFEASQSTSQSDQALAQGCRLDRRTRMMYDAYHIYINGESYQVKGRDTTLLCRLANERGLSGRDVAQLSVSARSQLAQWLQAGWLVAMPS